MKKRVAPCPSCGAPITFEISTSLVTVCSFCNSAVARGDKKLEDHGKVADLVITNSPLKLGMHGVYNRKGFDIVGRAQYQHPAGGVWDEWYLMFSNGKWGWLAEAQGRTYITFEKKLSGDTGLPDYDGLEVGTAYELGKAGRFTVVEKGHATALTVEGQVPWKFTPNQPMVFADLEGPDGSFASFEYTDGLATSVFVGQQLKLDELGLPLEAEAEPGWAAPNSQALSLNCPHCGGPLTLHAPDSTERVVCPQCNSMLDASQGKLEYFSTLNMRKVKPVLPLGKSGKLRGVEYTIIGLMERYTTYAGTVYPWTEYLLYSQPVGYRWLVHSEGHWSFAEPVSPGDITHHVRGLSYRGDSFKLFDKGRASVRYVVGEFYWKVMLGEEVETSDYIAPPQMISIEQTHGVDGTELNVSRGTHVPHEELEAAFGVENLWRPWSVGPCQPAPKNGGVFLLWLMFGGLLLGINALCSAMGKTVDQWLFFYGLVFVSVVPIGALVYAYQFEVNRWKDSDYSPYSSD